MAEESTYLGLFQERKSGDKTVHPVYSIGHTLNTMKDVIQNCVDSVHNYAETPHMGEEFYKIFRISIDTVDHKHIYKTYFLTGSRYTGLLSGRVIGID